MHPPAYLSSPDLRARVVGYLTTAVAAAPGYRTDGVFVWPQSLADAARDRGLAPPSDLFLHMRQSGFLLPAAVPAGMPADAASVDVTVSDVDTAEEARRVHDALLRRARESEPPDTGVRPARLFDGAGPAGTGWFSPARLRIPEPGRRLRLAAYLDGGRLVRRAVGEAPDPLNTWYGLRLGWRTDGVWVWPEALAHYMRTRGVAPELEFLCHIEARGYALAEVDDDRARAAAAVASRRPLPLPSRRVRYLCDDAGRLVRVWGASEVLGDDLRWEPVDVHDRDLWPIGEADAVALLDERWAWGAGSSTADAKAQEVR